MAVGMIEGSLTAELMYKSYQNLLAGYCNGDPDFCEKLEGFLADNLSWMIEQITSNPNDQYWYQVSCRLQ